MKPRVRLANLPTPLEPFDRLSEAWGGPRIWIKRDDLTGFGLSGNKVRKIEFHISAAIDAGATVLITTGAAQSNHCRATALAAARLGIECELFLRTPDGAPPEVARGNHLLHRLSGARLRFVTPAQYGHRDALMAERAEAIAGSGGQAWVIPEGASDYLGTLGFAAAGRELAEQLDGIGAAPPVWHAASSGGTTAGLVMAAAETAGRYLVYGCSIGDTVQELEDRLASIWAEARTATGRSVEMADPWLTADYVGGGYGVISDAELACQLEATRLTGLLFDPVYTGKAIYGLRQAIAAGVFDSLHDVVFWHTGGGFGVFAHDLGAHLAVE